MHFTSEQRLDDGVLEREFTLGEIPGILWTPAIRTGPADPGRPPRRTAQMYPRLAGRARLSAANGFAAATIELPGSGDRPRSAAAEQARADLRRAMAAGEPVDEIVDRPRPPAGRQGGPGMAGHPGRPPFTARDRRPGRVLGRGDRDRHPAGGGRAAHRGRRVCSPGASCPAPCSTRPVRSPSRCTSCCSGTTKGTTGSWRWTCSTPSAPRRRRCTPTWAGTPASRRSRRDASARFFARHLS